MLKRNVILGAMVIAFCGLMTLSFVSGYVVSRADVLHGPRTQVASLLQQIGVLDSAFAASTGPPPDAEELFRPFWEAWDLIAKEFYDAGAVDPQKLSRAALRGMVGAVGDPYTLYQDPQHRELSDAELRGSFEGIGIQVDLSDQHLRVVSPIAGFFRAEGAGLRPNDVITHVDGQPLSGAQLADTIKLIRGPRGTSVTLTVQREGTPTFDLSVVRDQIRLEAVTGDVRPDGIGYVKISSFTSNVSTQMRRTLDRLMEQSPTGWILDLRGNPGGTLDGAISVTSQFMPDGVVLYEQRRDGEKQEIRRRGEGKVAVGPMVVLVDKGSASASEIVAAALRDNGRATLVGTTTFGKGLVQVIHRLSDGSALRLTVARWLTPTQDLIQGIGLVPAIHAEGDSDQVLAQAVAYVRAQVAAAPETPVQVSGTTPALAGISQVTAQNAEEDAAILDGADRQETKQIGFA